MKFEDKYHLTPDENKRYAKANLARLVFANSRFEGLSTTLPQTETIVAGLGVDGVSVDDIKLKEILIKLLQEMMLCFLVS